MYAEQCFTELLLNLAQILIKGDIGANPRLPEVELDTDSWANQCDH